MDPEKWERVDSVETSSGVMVSNLPLLFANGTITSLQHMTLSELEVFVPFMVKCSVGENLKVAWSQLPKPAWWPTRLPFRLPSTSKESSTRGLLVRLVERCYTFHGCDYLLQFCLSLRQMTPAGGYRFADNRDGTTSMYHGKTGKLLVTFRNENKEYDKSLLKPKSPFASQKKLLPCSGLQSSTKNGVMVRPPISDVFLCDKCDDEFSSLTEVQAHEKQCTGGDSPETLKMPSPEPELLDDEQDTEEQVPFLSYLGLQPSKHTGIAPYRSPRKRQQTAPLKKPLVQSYLRFDTVDATSPLGKYILSCCKYGGKLQTPQQQVLKYEKLVYGSLNVDHVSTRERSASRWVVVWRPRREDQPWSHLYTFTSDQRRERLTTIERGLDKRSRELFSKCTPARVKLKRLAKRTINRATRLGGRTVPCIDLTSEDGSASTASLFSPQSVVFFPLEPVPVDPLVLAPVAPPTRDPLSLDPVPASAPDSAWYRATTPQPPPHNNSSSVDNYSNHTRVPALENGSDLHLPDGEFMSTQNKLKRLSNFGVKVSSIYRTDENKMKESVYNTSKESLHKNRQETSSISPHSRPNSSTSSSPSVPSLRAVRVSEGADYGTRRGTGCQPVNKQPLSYQHHSVLTQERSIPSTTLTPTMKPIEVIELSSDEEELSSVIGRSAFPPSGETMATSGRSDARSKNGYSHWSSKESSKCGRETGYSMANGCTVESDPPQPYSHFHYCCSHTSPSSIFSSTSSSSFHAKNVDGKNHPVLTLPHGSTLDTRRTNARYFYTPYFLQMTEDHGPTSSDPSHLVALDSEGTFKAPVQIDEDIFFNFRVKRLPPTWKRTEEHKKTVSVPSQTPGTGNNLIQHLANKVNKGFCYFATLLKENIYDNLKFNATMDPLGHDPINPITPEKSSASGRTHHPSPVGARNGTQAKRKRPKEVDNLLKDECLELKRRGIAILDCLAQNEKLTRRTVEREVAAKLASISTRKSRFFVVPTRKERIKRRRLKRAEDEEMLRLKRAEDEELLRIKREEDGETRLNRKDGEILRLNRKDRETLRLKRKEDGESFPQRERNNLDTKFSMKGERLDKGKKFKRTKPLTTEGIWRIMDEKTKIKSEFPLSGLVGEEDSSTPSVTPNFNTYLDILDENFNSHLLATPNCLNNNNECKRRKLIQNECALHACNRWSEEGHDKTPKYAEMLTNLSEVEFTSASTSPTSESSSPLSTPSPGSKRYTSLISFKGSSSKCRTNKPPEGDDGHSNTQEEDKEARTLMAGNKRLSRELSRLMEDEWKELRASGSHPSQISGLLSIQRTARSSGSSAYQKDTNDLSPYFFGSKHPRQLEEGGEWGTYQPSTPRKCHREMIRSENGMCIINYTFKNIG